MERVRRRGALCAVPGPSIRGSPNCAEMAAVMCGVVVELAIKDGGGARASTEAGALPRSFKSEGLRDATMP